MGNYKEFQSEIIQGNTNFCKYKSLLHLSLINLKSDLTYCFFSEKKYY